MEVAAEADDDFKLGLETAIPLCRCCLSTEKRLSSARTVGEYFMDLAGINVLASDGLPQWICYECNALLQKAAYFKYKILRAQTMLYEYITRCAPFPIDAQDPELAKYATPHLSITETLVFEADKTKLGFHKVLQHDKLVCKSELDTVSMPCQAVPELPPDDQGLKVERGFSDFEDDVPLEEFRSTTSQLLDEILDNVEGIKTEPEVKKRKKRKETKTKKRKKSVDEKPEAKKSIRRPIDIDPAKIKVITLNPQEQIKQREEESKASLKFPYQCNLCFKGFNFEVKLQNHMTKHSPSRGSFECTICSMYLPTSYSHAVHSLIHTRRYECRKCGRRMIDRTSIYHHYRSQHEGITTEITCQLCGKVSSNSKTHRGHMRNHHSGERPKCDQCGKSFVNKDSLTDHMQIHEGVKNYECSVCGKRCRTRTQIKNHQLKHTDVRDYYCVECDVRFKTHYNLRQHLLKSLKHKDLDSLKFPCPRCGKRFLTASSLEQHERIQHLGIRVHACGACGAALASRASLHKHAATVHGGRRAPARHVCDACGKAFRGKSVLTNHMRTHTGEKPFPCGSCGRAFSQRTAMLTHARRVHADKGKKVEAEPRGVFAPKEEPLVVNTWRPQDIFFVTAGP